MRVELGKNELDELHKTDPSDRRKGGFQAYLIKLQERLNNDGIDLAHEDLVKINRYASYTSGGYQTRLKKIFGPTLGKYLHGLNR